MYMKTTIAIAGVALLLTGCDKAQMQRGHYKVPTVEVALHLDAATNIWTVDLDGSGKQNPKNAKTVIPTGADPTMFVVDIKGAQTFRNSDPLSVWEGANAKTLPQSGINSNQIIGPFVTKNRKSLVFFDLNQGNKVTLNYELHFNGGTPSVDPIIENNP